MAKRRVTKDKATIYDFAAYRDARAWREDSAKLKKVMELVEIFESVGFNGHEAVPCERIREVVEGK